MAFVNVWSCLAEPRRHLISPKCLHAYSLKAEEQDSSGVPSILPLRTNQLFAFSFPSFDISMGPMRFLTLFT